MPYFRSPGHTIIMEYLMYIAAVYGHIVLAEIDCLEIMLCNYSKIIQLMQRYQDYDSHTVTLTCNSQLVKPMHS